MTKHPSHNIERGAENLLDSVRDMVNKLNESEERYRSLVESSPDGICVVLNNKLVYLNQSASVLLGEDKPKKLLGKSIFEYIPRQKSALVAGFLKKTLKGVKLSSKELQLHQRSGQIIDIEADFSQIRFQSKRSILAIFRDISEKKEAKKLRDASNSLIDLLNSKVSKKEYFSQTLQLLKILSECASVGIRILDSEGNIPFQSYIGYSNEFWKKENWLSVNRDNCACSRAVSGHWEKQDITHTTEFGSFFFNDSACFINSLKKEARKQYRGECIKVGYRSIAVVPIRYNNTTLGAVHFASKSAGKFTIKKIQLIESITALIGEAIHKYSIEQGLEKKYDTQTAINSLLQLTLEDTTIEEILNRALTLILSVPWLSFEATGSIFLADKSGRTLKMAAQQGLSPKLKEKCAAIPFGRCLCGKAALKKEIIFSNTTDPGHEVRHRGMKKHGHYCVPILLQKRVLGVINIYIKYEHNKTLDDIDFLTAIANTLAGIIERKDQQQALSLANRALRALSACNHTLIHTQEELALLQEVCRIIVELGGYQFAWVGRARRDRKKTVMPIAQVGFESGYLDKANISWSKNSPFGKGPTGKAIRTGKICIGDNFDKNPMLSPWRKEALQRNFSSSIALPLKSEGKTYGVLSIYAKENNAFDTKEVLLLSELADDLAFGIVNLRMKEAHKKAQEALRESNQLLERTFSTTNFMLAYLDINFNFIRVNSAYAAANDQTPEYFVGKSLFKLYPNKEIEQIFKGVFNTGIAYNALAKPFFKPQKNFAENSFWNWTLQPVKDDQQIIIGLLLSLVDVTDQINAEKKLLESYKHLGIINRQISILLELNKQSGGKNTEEIMKYIVNSAINTSKAEEVHLFEYKESKKALCRIYSSGHHLLECRRANKLIAVEKNSELHPLIYSQTRFQGTSGDAILKKFSRTNNIKYFLILPLNSSNKLRGAIFLGFSDRDSITTQEVEFYEAFAAQASHILGDLGSPAELPQA